MILHLHHFCRELESERTATTCAGIVAKPKISPYREVKGQTTWIKVKNPDYSQAEGRQELFNKRR